MPSKTNDLPLVYVIDDDISVREGLAALLATVGVETRLFERAHDFLECPLIERPGCLVVDIRLPDMSGLDVQSRLSQGGVALPVVVMTGYADVPMSVRAMKRGAVDFLPKPFNDQDMIDAVFVAIEKDRAHRQSQESLRLVQQRFATLSARERQVMLSVTSGKMNKQVAGDLGLSEITVKIHRASAMRKMKARTLPDLVRMVELIGARHS